jgi:hypothetical protein
MPGYGDDETGGEEHEGAGTNNNEKVFALGFSLGFCSQNRNIIIHLI